MGDFGQNANEGSLAFWPKWPIFMAQLCKPRKIGNANRILVKILLFGAEFILLFVDTKTSKKKSLFAKESHFPTTTQNVRF